MAVFGFNPRVSARRRKTVHASGVKTSDARCPRRSAYLHRYRGVGYRGAVVKLADGNQVPIDRVVDIEESVELLVVDNAIDLASRQRSCGINIA